MSTPASTSRRLKVYRYVKDHKTCFLALEGSQTPLTYVPHPTEGLVDEMNWLEITVFANGFLGHDLSDSMRRGLLELLARVPRPTARIQQMELHDRDEGGGLIKTYRLYLCIGLRPVSSYPKFPRGILVLDQDREKVERLVKTDIPDPERAAEFWRCVKKAEWPWFA